MADINFSEIDPFGEPDCESEVKLLGEEEYKRYYFAHTKFNSEAIKKNVYLIIGRRGSGKTALSRFFSFQKAIENIIAIDVDEPEAFQEFMSRIASSTHQSREVAIPKLVRVWEYIIWGIIFRQLKDKDGRIKAACIFSEEKGRPSHFIRQLLKDLIAKYANASNDLVDELENIVSSETMLKAKQAVFEISKHQPIIIAFDTLENYSLKDESMMRATAALIQCSSNFDRDFSKHNIFIKLFVMAEIFPHLKEETILNTLKFIRDEIYLHWNPKDLMRLVSWRYWSYLRAFGMVPENKEINWDNHQDVLQTVWFPSFGRELINGGGLHEMSFPYVLRHTQLRPRQLIVLCNCIAKIARENGNFPRLRQNDLIMGIKEGEEKLAEEVFNSYKSVYPNAAKIAEALSGLPLIFDGNELDKRGRVTASEWEAGEYSQNNFRRFVAELGIVGRVRKVNQQLGIVGADFEYAMYGRLPILPSDRCVVHPMFYKKLNIKMTQKLIVYPFPDSNEFKELKYVDW